MSRLEEANNKTTGESISQRHSQSLYKPPSRGGELKQPDYVSMNFRVSYLKCRKSKARVEIYSNAPQE